MDFFLTFSDSAKFANIARNLVLGLGYGDSFAFWGTAIFDLIKQNIFPALWIPPVMPLSIAIFFKIFGINNFAVIATSFSYFILTLVFVFLLTRKIFNNRLTSFLTTIAVGFNPDLIKYSTSGASESALIFEIVLAAYVISLKKKWGIIATVLIMVLMYFTRPQAFIYIIGLILFWLLNNYKIKKATICLVGILIIGFLVDRLVLLPLNGKMFLYSISGRGIDSAFVQAASSSTSDALRGNVDIATGGVIKVAKNIFYNLYNFYKLLPQILNPYLFTLFAIGIFKWNKDKRQNSFKIATIFMFVMTFLVTAASIPFFRYLHPVIPLVYIVAVGTLIEISLNFESSILARLTINNFRISKQIFTIFSSLILILIFSVGQTLGIIFLDSRFEKGIHNINKPPICVKLSHVLKENTNPNDLVITNLDTWGSWYGERQTIWFPVEPKLLINPETGKIPFDAIYLTSYKIDDENYYMGDSWRMIFENPGNPKKWTCDGCVEIAKEFTLKGIYKISADDNYERQDATGILLVRKH